MSHRFITSLASLAAVVALAAFTSTGLALAKSSTPKRATPNGWSFYTPPHPLPPGRDGELIWARRIASPLPRVGRMYLVLYRSTGVGGRPAAVSGTVMIPVGRAPKGGWPVISWAHGTTGIADRCAPSLSASTTTSPIQRAVDAWARDGYAIARTDYAGLGTPGTHPYLVGQPEGRNVIDIVRAARQLDRRVGRNWISAGHSQGGQAALFAAAEAARHAPELRLRGAAAFAPASHIGDELRAVGAFTQPSPLSGYGAIILEGAAAASPRIDLGAIESDAALALRPQISKRCLGDLEKPGSYGALAPASLIRDGADLSGVERFLDAQNPAAATKVPVVLFQGASDATVPQPLTDELAAELRTKGDRVSYWRYAGVNHVGVVGAADSAFRAWLRDHMRHPSQRANDRSSPPER